MPLFFKASRKCVGVRKKVSWEPGMLFAGSGVRIMGLSPNPELLQVHVQFCLAK